MSDSHSLIDLIQNKCLPTHSKQLRHTRHLLAALKCNQILDVCFPLMNWQNTRRLIPTLCNSLCPPQDRTLCNLKCSSNFNSHNSGILCPPPPITLIMHSQSPFASLHELTLALNCPRFWIFPFDNAMSFLCMLHVRCFQKCHSYFLTFFCLLFL